MTTRRPSRLIALALALASTDVAAQVRLDRYSAPPSPGDGLRLSRPTVLGHREVGGLLAVDYADDPLVLELERGLASTERAKLVETQLQAHARLAYGLYDRLMLGVGFEFAMVQTGEGWADRATGSVIAPDDGSGVGDAQVSARYLAIGGDDERIALAIDGKLSLPLARAANPDQNLTGERSLAGGPEVAFEVRPGPLRIGANVGAIVRRDSRVFNTRFGDEMTFGLGAGFQLPGEMRCLEALAEVYGSTAIDDLFGDSVTPIEGLVGARWSAGERWRVSLAGGTGITRGIGSPDARALASLGLITSPDPDADNDSLREDEDRCPSDAEDHDGSRDDDGCPDPDDDDDGVLDAVDRCRSEAEDRDSFRDDDGCPDLDNDADGVPDARDRCVAEAEDVDGDRDADGCPDAAGEAAAVSGAEAACAPEAGVAAGKGCPAAPSPLPADQGLLRFEQRIEFAQGGADLLASSDAVLEEIRTELDRRPELRLIAIEGHTDGSGAADYNVYLSGQRAQSVARWLIQHGISASRLRAWGCGKNRPLAPETSREARQRNRRVELHVLEPAPSEPHPTDGCSEVPVTAP